jgi:hypothetical protein
MRDGYWPTGLVAVTTLEEQLLRRLRAGGIESGKAGDGQGERDKLIRLRMALLSSLAPGQNFVYCSTRSEYCGP